MEKHPDQTYMEDVADEQRILEQDAAPLLGDADVEATLRPHQNAVFEDIRGFFASGDKLGYVELPTGTGKTVLFVKLAQALVEVPEHAEPPKVLVVVPTRDLVHQTMGRSGEKGFGGFASNLTVRAFFSGASEREKELFTQADVGVTTYDSFQIMRSAPDFVPARDLDAEILAGMYHTKLRNQLSVNDHMEARTAFRRSETQAQTYMRRLRGANIGDPILNTFDIIILDEAHHALEGTTAAQLIKSLSPEKYVIGFTATPDADEGRKLSAVLPHMIHKMDLGEAVNMNLLSPILPIGVASGMRIKGSDIYDASGDFIQKSLSYLRLDEHRNDLIVEAAKVFAEKGVGTIVSCMAGDGAAHARHIAERLQAQGIRAVAVYEKISPLERQEIYEQFESGEIDVITFIDVLGEGWDSNRAKAIVNGRPTRSAIFSEQRPGRVARFGGVAYAVDIIDEFEGENAPITVADILERGDITFGQALGEIEDRAAVDDVLGSLRARLPVMPVVRSNYVEYRARLAAAAKLDNGRGAINGREYVLPTRIAATHVGVDEELLLRAAAVQGVTLKHSVMRSGNLLRIAYEAWPAREVLYAIPEFNPGKYHVDSTHQRWAAAQGLVSAFSKGFPHINEDIMQTTLDTLGDELEWMPGKYRVDSSRDFGKRYKLAKMYVLTRDTVSTLKAALTEYFTENS